MTDKSERIYPWYSYRCNIPKQRNGYDCGIFLIEFVARFLDKHLNLIGTRRLVIQYPKELLYECLVLYKNIDRLKLPLQASKAIVKAELQSRGNHIEDPDDP